MKRKIRESRTGEQKENDDKDVGKKKMFSKLYDVRKRNKRGRENNMKKSKYQKKTKREIKKRIDQTKTKKTKQSSRKKLNKKTMKI